MPDAGGAQSGYLIEHGGFRLLLECGGGVFAKLRAMAEPAAVDAVLVSHMHADHVLDLIAYAFALERHVPRARATGPTLWCPPGGAASLAAFERALGMAGQIERGFELREYDPSVQLALGPLRVSFCPVPHFVPAWAADIRCEDARLTYGADCGPNEAIVELAAGSDLLMLEATLGAGTPPAGSSSGHLTAREAGALASRAGVPRLLLTHYSDQLDADAVRAAARTAFAGDVQLAAEGLLVQVGARVLSCPKRFVSEQSDGRPDA